MREISLTYKLYAQMEMINIDELHTLKGIVRIYDSAGIVTSTKARPIADVIELFHQDNRS